MQPDFPALYALEDEALRELARTNGIDPAGHRHDVVLAIGRIMSAEYGPYGMGVLDVHREEGFGFLRSAAASFQNGPDDIYVSQSQIRRFKLQTGDTIIGLVRPPKEGERYTALLRVDAVNGARVEDDRQGFDQLTAIYPDERFTLGDDPVLQAVDRVAPLGLGARGLLIAPPRTRANELLARLANALAEDAALHVTVLLVAERPEEIQEWRKTTRAEVIATPFDEPPARHVQVADIVFERARRMVEQGDEAVLLVDNFSRLLRACLAESAPSGRDLDGVDAGALHRMRRWLGAARMLDEGGSLTVIGVLGADGTRHDRVLAEDLREVVNWELTLSRPAAEAGLFPAIDVARSGALRPERLRTAEEAATWEALAATFTGDVVADATRVLRPKA